MERKILVMRHRGANEGLLLSKKGIERVLVPRGHKPKVSTITYSRPMFDALVDKADKSRAPRMANPEMPRAQAEALIRTKRRGYTYIALVKTDGIEMHRKTISTGFCEGTPISAIPDTGKKNFVNLVHSHLFNLGYPKPYPRDLDDLCVHVWELNEEREKGQTAKEKTLTANDVLQASVGVGYRYHCVNGEFLNTLTIVDSGFTVTTEEDSLPVGYLRMEPGEFVKLQNYLMKGVPPGSHKTWTKLFGVDDSEENPLKRWAAGKGFGWKPFEVLSNPLSQQELDKIIGVTVADSDTEPTVQESASFAIGVDDSDTEPVRMWAKGKVDHLTDAQWEKIVDRALPEVYAKAKCAWPKTYSTLTEEDVRRSMLTLHPPKHVSPGEIEGAPEGEGWVKGKWKWPFSPLTPEEVRAVKDPVAHTESPYRTPDYYDNSKGSLYKVAGDRGWNSYLFDIVKSLERGGKKDPLETEINKTIALLELWKNEIVENKR